MKPAHDRIEEADTILNEVQAIVSFLDKATLCLAEKNSYYDDDIHKESDYGLHLCFELALERMAKAREMIFPEIPEGGKS